jgi:hypothetical protein
MKTLQPMIGNAAEGYARRRSADPEFRFVLTMCSLCKFAQ